MLCRILKQMMLPVLLASALLAACDDGEDGPSDAGTDGDTTATGPCVPEPGRCTDTQEAPAPLSEHGAAFDEGSQTMVVFGGTTGTPVNCAFPASEYRADTWLFDDLCGSWRRAEGASPAARGRHAMVSDRRGGAWIFGGRTRTFGSESGPYALFDDLWHFDFGNESWTEIVTEGPRPGPRFGIASAVDGSGRLWIHGGNSSASGGTYAAIDELWSYDPNTRRWQQHSAEGAPPPRLLHAMVFDPRADSLLVFGGADEGALQNDATYFGDMYAWHIAEARWTTLDPGRASGPEGRFWPGLVWNPHDEVPFLFGGHDDRSLGNRNDTWRWDRDREQWFPESFGDEQSSTANGFCDFPADFVTLDIVPAPERRSAHAIVASETCRSRHRDGRKDGLRRDGRRMAIRLRGCSLAPRPAGHRRRGLRSMALKPGELREPLFVIANRDP